MAKIWLCLASLLAAAAVGMGAFHAHGLEEYLRDANLEPEAVGEKMANCGTAVDYQMFHAFAILVVGLVTWRGGGKMVFAAGGLFFLGMLGFSGGIYATVFDLAPIHFVIPIGGLLLMVGWVVLAVGVLFVREPAEENAK